MTENQNPKCEHGNKFGNCAAGCLSPESTKAFEPCDQPEGHDQAEDIKNHPDMQAFMETSAALLADFDAQVEAAKSKGAVVMANTAAMDADGISESRKQRKVATAAMANAMHAMKGRSGLSKAEKTAQLQSALDFAQEAVDALTVAIEAAQQD